MSYFIYVSRNRSFRKNFTKNLVNLNFCSLLHYFNSLDGSALKKKHKKQENRPQKRQVLCIIPQKTEENNATNSGSPVQNMLM